MEILTIILLTIGIFALFEGLIVALFPKSIQSIFQDKNILRKAGITEIIIAILLISTGIYLILFSL